MSLHPPKGFIVALSPKAEPAPRVNLVVFGGVIISRAHARRPRILRLEPSKPRGGSKP